MKWREQAHALELDPNLLERMGQLGAIQNELNALGGAPVHTGAGRHTTVTFRTPPAERTR